MYIYIARERERERERESEIWEWGSQALWDPLTAGELLARVGHFIRSMSQMMEEVGYLAEVLPGDIEKKKHLKMILQLLYKKKGPNLRHS